MWWWIATTLSPLARSAFRTGVTSGPSIATSPATSAFASLPKNAAQVSRNLGDLRRVNLSGRDAGVSAGYRALVLRRYMANQVNRRLRHFREIGSLSVTVDVHVKDAGTFKKEVIVDSGHLESVVEQSRHDWVDLVLGQ